MTRSAGSLRVRPSVLWAGLALLVWTGAPAAAAGSLLLFTYAWEDLERFLKPPELR